MRRAERIRKLAETNPFVEWAMGKYGPGEDPERDAYEDSPKGDFVSDVGYDRGFPEKADHGEILSHLRLLGACPGAVDAFEELWSEYLGDARSGG